MNLIVSESKKEERSPVLLAFFVLNAIVTIGIATVIICMTLSFLMHDDCYVAEEEKQSAETAAFIISVLTAWGITDAIFWGKGKQYAGYLMMIYSGLHFYRIVLIFGEFKSIYMDYNFSAWYFPGIIVILAPLVIDILVIWFVGKSHAKKNR